MLKNYVKEWKINNVKELIENGLLSSLLLRVYNNIIYYNNNNA